VGADVLVKHLITNVDRKEDCEVGYYCAAERSMLPGEINTGTGNPV